MKIFKIYFLHFLLILNVGLILESVAFSEEIERAFTKIRYYGKKYSLYTTETPNIFRDRNSELWTAVPRKTEGLQYIPLKAMTPSEQARVMEIAAGPDTRFGQKTMIDVHGKEWIGITDKETPSKKRWVQIEKVSSEEIIQELHKFSYSNIPGDSLKALVPENFKFSAATLLVEMSVCFSPGISDYAMSALGHAQSPTCLTNFVEHLLDPKGWISFYGFIVAHRGAQTAILQNILQLTAAHRGTKDPRVIAQIAAKIHPWANYLGMAVGSLASSVITHILSAPEWGNCFKNLKKENEGITSQYCKDAVTHILSVDGFWDDFIGSSTAMILAGIGSAKTQELMSKSPALLRELLQNKSLGSMKLLGSSPGLAENLGKKGLSLAQKIRMAPAIVGGAPGVVITVITTIGHYTMFVAWDFLLREPVLTTYQDFTKSGTLQNTIEKLLNMIALSNGDKKAQPINKSNSAKLVSVQSWTIPLLEDQCRIYGLNSFPIEGFADGHQNEPTTVCEQSLPLVEQIHLLQKTAATFRQKVALYNFEEAAQKWQSKIKSYMDSYRVYKSILSYIYLTRSQLIEKKVIPDTSLNQEGLYFKLVSLWSDVLENEEIHIDPQLKTKIESEIQKSKKNVEAFIIQDQQALLEPLIIEKTIQSLVQLQSSKAFRPELTSEILSQQDRKFSPWLNAKFGLIKDKKTALEFRFLLEKRLKLMAELQQILNRKSLKEYIQFIDKNSQEHSQVFSGVERLDVKRVLISLARESAFAREYQDLRKKIIAHLQFQQQPKNSLEAAPQQSCAKMDPYCFARRWTIHFDGSRYSQGNPFVQSTLDKNSEFIRSLAAAYGESIVNRTLHTMLCEGPQKIKTQGTSWWGRAATFEGPQLIQNADKQEFYDQNCISFGEHESSSHERYAERAFSKVWVMNNKMFADPLSLLIHQETVLVTGDSENEMAQWWTQNAFLPMSEFIRQASHQYQKLLQEKLFPQIPQVSAQELIHRTSPQMRGATLERFIGSPVRGLTGETPLYAESVMGQVQLLMEIAQWSTPLAQKDQKILNEIKLAFAEYVLGLNYPLDTTKLDQTWKDAFQDFNLSFKDRNLFVRALDRQNRNLREAGLGSVKIKLMIEQRQKIMDKIDELYLKLSGQDYKNMGSETSAWKKPLSQEKIKELSGDKYRNYIFYILFHNTLSNLLSEIDASYDKLGLKPLVGFGPGSH